MDAYRVIEVKRSVFADNNAGADRLRAELSAQGTHLVKERPSGGRRIGFPERTINRYVSLRVRPLNI